MQTHEWEEWLHEAPEDHLPGKKAVAEVIRLRRALEGRIRVWEEVADRLAAQGDQGAELMRIALNQITRILEGDTDE